MPHTYAFPKREKLCSSTAVNRLYENGKSFVCYPLRATWQTTDSDMPIRVLIWAPKSKFKRANKRNLIRRWIREAYRLEVQPLKEMLLQSNRQIELSLVYMTADLTSQGAVRSALKKTINKLIIANSPIDGTDQQHTEDNA